MTRGRATRGFALAGAIAILPSPAGPGAGQPFLVNTPLGSGIALSWLEPRPGATGHRLRLSMSVPSDLGEVDETSTWLPATTIAEGDSFFVNWADFPVVSFAGHTRVIAAWPWRIGAGTYAYQVRTSISLDGGRTWPAPVIPHRDTTATEHGFVSLVPDAGGFRVVWLDGRNTGTEPPGAMTLRTALLTPEGTIRDEQELDDRVCDCCASAMAVTRDGVVVAYRDRTEEEVRDISVVRRVNGRWTAPVTIPGDGWKFAACPVNGPALVASGDRIVLAWYTAARDSPMVKVAISEDGGATFGPPIRLNEETAVGRVDLAAFGRGGVVVSWIERIGDEGRAAIVHRVLGEDGAWRPRRLVQEVSSARTTGVPQLVVGPGRRRVVFAWTESGTASRVRLGAYDLEVGAPARR